MSIDRSPERISYLCEFVKEMKLDALGMIKAAGAKGAHVGGGFSCMEILAVLYGEVLRLTPDAPLSPERDRLLISKNHCTIAHFPALAQAGFISRDDLYLYVKDGSRLIGYPYDPEIGLEYSGGSLGMAISVAVGQALALKRKGISNRIYVLMGDGELNEGSVWEGLMSAAQYKLNNLTVIIDNNHICYDGATDDIMSLGDIAEKFAAFGFETASCDGHSIGALLDAFAGFSGEKPAALIADTVKGHGISFAENRPEWHQHAMTEQQYELAMKEITEAYR